MKYKPNKIEYVFKTWEVSAPLLKAMKESLRLMGATNIQLDTFIVESNHGKFFATCEEEVAKEFSKDWEDFLHEL